MALTLPRLDDRRWADLVEEGRSLLPLYAPGWTDHNLHDPGITLMELFAWVAEMDLYRLDRVPAAHIRKFLALLGFAPLPPAGAEVAVGPRLKSGSDPLPLPAGLLLDATTAAGERVGYLTTEPVTLVPGALAALQSQAGGEVRDLTAAWRRGEPVAPFGDDPRVGDALYLGFSEPPPAGALLSLWLEVEGGGAGERQRLLERRREAALCRPSGQGCGCEKCAEHAHQEEAPEAPLVHPSVRLAWETAVPGGFWQPLDEIEDDTRALTLSGRLTLHLPEPPEALRVGELDAPFPYLRCRIAGGAYDAPPRLLAVILNGVRARQEVPVVAPGAQVDGDPPAEGVALGRGSGRPGQILDLPELLPAGEELTLWSLEEGAWKPWRRRPDLDASGRAGADFVVEPRLEDTAAGVPLAQVRFGDGEHGRTVPEGAPVWAAYRATRGRLGALPAGALLSLADGPHNRALLPDFDAILASLTGLDSPLPSQGGSNGESLDGAALRALEAAETSERAVTLADYERLALATPGTRLARAEARAEMHPAFPCYHAPGVVTVLVLPFLPAGRPTPSRGLLAAVAAYLNRRRVLGTRVEVAGPVYVEVRVRARVQAYPGVDRAALAARLRDALDRFFHPLHGGPGGGGWPFGRAVYGSEVYQVLDETAGTDHVLALELIGADGEPHCDNLCLPAAGLPASGAHEIEVEGGGGAC
jgi:predicted phage baseplate assembly protein